MFFFSIVSNLKKFSNLCDIKFETGDMSFYDVPATYIFNAAIYIIEKTLKHSEAPMNATLQQSYVFVIATDDYQWVKEKICIENLRRYHQLWWNIRNTQDMRNKTKDTGNNTQEYNSRSSLECNSIVCDCKSESPIASSVWESVFVEVLEQATPRELVLHLLSHCEHVIATMGTFSWWIAFLNRNHHNNYARSNGTEGIVIHYERMNKDIVPPTWIAMG